MLLRVRQGNACSVRVWVYLGYGWFSHLHPYIHYCLTLSRKDKLMLELACMNDLQREREIFCCLVIRCAFLPECFLCQVCPGLTMHGRGQRHTLSTAAEGNEHHGKSCLVYTHTILLETSIPTTRPTSGRTKRRFIACPSSCTRRQV